MSIPCQWLRPRRTPVPLAIVSWPVASFAAEGSPQRARVLRSRVDAGGDPDSHGHAGGAAANLRSSRSSK